MKSFICFLIVILISYNNIFAEGPTQIIRGSVVDKNMQTSLPGAKVQVISVNPVKGAFADGKGNFKIEKIPVGRHTIKVSFIGYKDAVVPDVLLISGKEFNITIELEESVVNIKDIIVKADEDELVATNDLIISSVTTLKPELINRFAGSRSDPSKIAANTAGVAGEDSQRNDIIVRGNSPLGVLWRMEGVDIPNPNHFTVAATGGGAFAIINNNLLANCDFITGAFPAEYGNKTAAVFDVRLRNGNNEKFENTFQLGLNGLEFGNEGPISVENGSSYLVNGRFVTLSPLRWLGVHLTADVIPEYIDGSFKVNIPTKSSGIFTVWGIGGRSALSVFNSKDEDIDWTRQLNVEDSNIESIMYAVAVSHTYFFGDNLFGKLNISNSASIIHTFNEYIYSDGHDELAEEYKGTEGQNYFNYDLTWKLSNQHLLKTGVTWKQQYYNLDFMDMNESTRNLEQRMKADDNANLFQYFAHWRYKITDDIECNTGVFAQLFDLNNTYSIEPRFSLSYRNENQKYHIAYGMHSQTHPLLYYNYLFRRGNEFEAENINMDMMRAHHFTAGYQNQIWDDFKFKVEAYYQHLYDVPVSLRQGMRYYSLVNIGAEYAFQPQDSTVNIGKGRNFGVELTFDKSYSNGWYSLISTSLFRSYYTDADDIERSTAFDMGYILNILAGKEFKLDDDNHFNLSIDGKLALLGGRRIVPTDVQMSIDKGYRVYDGANAYNQQLDDHFQIDIKITLNINLAKTTHNIFLAADNMLNRQNVARYDWNNDLKKLTYDYHLGVLPYLGYRVNF